MFGLGADKLDISDWTGKDVVPRYSDETGKELGESAIEEIIVDTVATVGVRDSDWVTCG